MAGSDSLSFLYGRVLRFMEFVRTLSESVAGQKGTAMLEFLFVLRTPASGSLLSELGYRSHDLTKGGVKPRNLRSVQTSLPQRWNSCLPRGQVDYSGLWSVFQPG